MLPTVNMTRRQPRFADWLRPRLRWITVPSWVVSTGLHIGLLFLLVYLAQLKSCRHDIQGDGGDAWRQVGIVTRAETPPSDSTAADTAESNDSQFEEAVQSDQIASTTSADPVPAAPPIDLPALPSESEPIVGVGPTPGVSSRMVDSLIQANSGGGASAPPSSGEPGRTGFLGASDVGSRFVYVIDKSFSMANDNALRAAKAELTASLQRLNESQQFQVIFYNTDGLDVMQTRDNRFDLFWGTDAQRLLAANQYQAVRAGAGTDHFPALQRALKFNPDVVFFLTDGKEPPLTAGDLDSISRMNRGARIHCIEFGKGPLTGDPALVDPVSWIQQLARENSGTYVYQDLNELFTRAR